MLVSNKARFLGHDFISDVLYDDIDNLESLLDATCFGYEPFTENYGFVLNSKGFRTKEYERKKPEGTYRIVFLGDSFTINSGPLPYEHHWVRHLDQWASERFGERVELINLGIPCSGPEFQKRLWEIEAASLEPDLVVHAFCTVNDYQDDVALKTQQGRNVGIEIGAETSFRESIFRALYKASAFVRMLHNVLKLQGVEQTADDLPTATMAPDEYDHGGFAVETRPFDPDQASYTESMYLTVNKAFLGWLHEDFREYFDQQAEGAHAALRAMYDSIRASGATLLVVIVPGEHQVDQEFFNVVIDSMGLPAEEFDLELPQVTLRNMLDEEGIPYIDLLDTFRQAHSGPNSLYILRDSHWNPAGNALAAETIEPVLEQIITRDMMAEASTP
ncbi:SGNH/GDSL hydrolase family protein [Oceanidesulfovibrio indonesiensis]|nr:SGNH/GDSL hydrolase family protein [Oceanidesulfovibrio indonesiensis]